MTTDWMVKNDEKEREMKMIILKLLCVLVNEQTNQIFYSLNILLYDERHH